jgi:hypothetical protein
MSALPPKADIRQRRWDVRKVPLADVEHLAIGFKQHGHRPRSRPGVSLPPPRQPVAAAVEHSRHCGGGDDLRCGRADPVAPPFQVESSRRAPLTGDPQLNRWKWCRVISGGCGCHRTCGPPPVCPRTPFLKKCFLRPADHPASGPPHTIHPSSRALSLASFQARSHSRDTCSTH